MMYEMTGIDEVALPFLYVNEIKKNHGRVMVDFVEKYIASLFDARVYTKEVYRTEGYYCQVMRHRATRVHAMSVDIVLSEDCSYKDVMVPEKDPHQAHPFPNIDLFCTHGNSVRNACTAIDNFMIAKFADSGLMVSSGIHRDVDVFRREYEPLAGRNLYITVSCIDKAKNHKYPRYLDFLRTLNVFKSKRFKN